MKKIKDDDGDDGDGDDDDDDVDDDDDADDDADDADDDDSNSIRIQNNFIIPQEIYVWCITLKTLQTQTHYKTLKTNQSIDTRCSTKS